MTTDTRAGIEDLQTKTKMRTGAEKTRVTTNNKKLIALDVDGTLVDHEGQMSEQVREAAQAVVEAGHEVMIATGRSLNATLPVIQKIGMTSGYSVCSNGGVTLRIDMDLPDGYEVLNRVTFDPKQALMALREKLPTAKYALEDNEGNFLSTERFQDESFGIEAKAVDFNTLLEATAVRVVVFSSETEPDDFARAIHSAGLDGVTYSVGWTAWLDIAASGVTKASALENLRQELNIDPSRTVAIGDGRNDVEMLSWAARGIAMGQAPAEVADAATEVTASVYDDGAAKVLRGLL
ncbi:MAG TPA: HAD family hydrolase [Arthrobacter sp.]|nr:HAD family hydrolase [Arthrobacter sp.]